MTNYFLFQKDAYLQGNFERVMLKEERTPRDGGVTRGCLQKKEMWIASRSYWITG